VIINELNTVRPVASPDEADAKLVVHADRPLALAVGGQRVKPISWRRSQIFNRPRRIELGKPAANNPK
jgi:hypothetical protein